MVAERDDHWMPEIYTGEMTPEVIKKKNITHEKAIEIRERMKKVYRIKKAALQDETSPGKMTNKVVVV